MALSSSSHRTHKTHEITTINFNEAPVMTKPTVVSDFLQTFKVISQLHVKSIGGDLGVLSILVIFLSVQKPVWDFELTRIGDDCHQIVYLSIRKFSALLFMSTSAFLQTMLAKRRPIPLIEVIANIIFCFPSTFVFCTRRMC